MRILSRLNPFRSLPNPREAWAWGMFDLANQSFALLIITMFFSVYVREVVAPDPEMGEWYWGMMGSVSMLLVVVISPVVGAVADARAIKKPMLVGLGLVCATLTCLLAAVGPGALVLAALLFLPANIAFNLGENLLGSFLPQIATSSTMGRVSAIGWAMGYGGAMILLVLSGVLIVVNGWHDPTQWRPLFLFAGLWFLAASLPTILILRERAHPIQSSGGAIRLAFSRLASTARDARHHRHLLGFLGVFLIYSTGTHAVIYFAGVLARSTFGFGTTKLVLFVLQLTVTAGLGAILAGLIQDRLGSRRTVMVYLASFAGSAAGLAILLEVGAARVASLEWIFWTLANGIGFGLGGIGTSSRALIGVMTPTHKAAEFFGLWGMVYKGAGVIGPVAFGTLKASAGDTASMLMLVGVFGIGLVLMLRVDERAGNLAARDAEAFFGGGGFVPSHPIPPQGPTPPGSGGP